MGAWVSEVDGTYEECDDKGGHPRRGPKPQPEGTWLTAHHTCQNLACLHVPRTAGLLASESRGLGWLQATLVFIGLLRGACHSAFKAKATVPQV